MLPIREDDSFKDIPASECKAATEPPWVMTRYGSIESHHMNDWDEVVRVALRKGMNDHRLIPLTGGYADRVRGERRTGEPEKGVPFVFVTQGGVEWRVRRVWKPLLEKAT